MLITLIVFVNFVLNIFAFRANVKLQFVHAASAKFIRREFITKNKS